MQEVNFDRTLYSQWSLQRATIPVYKYTNTYTELTTPLYAVLLLLQFHYSSTLFYLVYILVGHSTT